MVNNKSSRLSSCRRRSAAPGRDGEHAMLLAEVARRRRHNRALGNDQLLPRPNRPPYVFLTDEVEGHLVCLRRRRLDRCIGLEAARPQEQVDPVRQSLGADAGRGRRTCRGGWEFRADTWISPYG